MEKRFIATMPVAMPAEGASHSGTNTSDAIPSPTWGVDFANRSLPAGVSFSRASTASHYNENGDRVTAATNSPRFDHTPAGAFLGLLIEESRTNHLLNSTAPASQTVSLGTGTYCLWLAGSGTCTASAGTATGSGFGSASEGSPLVFTLTGGGTVVFNVSGTVSRFQCENAPQPSSFIVTTSAAATRSADICHVPDAVWLNTNEGTFVVHFGKQSAPPGGTYPTLYQADDGSANNRIFGYHSSFNSLNMLLRSNGVNVFDQASNGTVVLGAGLNRAVQAYKSASHTFGLNGGTFVNRTDAAVPMALTTLRIGSQTSGNYYNGWIKRIVYYNSQLKSAHLSTLATQDI